IGAVTVPSISAVCPCGATGRLGDRLTRARRPLTLQPFRIANGGGPRTMTRRGWLWCLVAGAGAGCAPGPATYRIGVVPKGLTHEFWQSIYRGAARAAADLTGQLDRPVEVIW